MLGHPDAPAIDLSGAAPTAPLVLPSAAPIFANDSTQMGVDPSTGNPVTRIVGALGKQLLNAAMAPGEAYQSTQPITTDQMIAPAADLAGFVTLGAGAAPAEADALRMGIKAYHGSPHDFDAFDMSKIGTGEGAQAYGHGLYFAENEKVAKGYRDALSLPKSGDQLGNAYDLVRQLGEDGALKAVEAALPRNPQLQVELDAIKSGAYRDWKPQGRMYEVDINADPEQFLDWDKPLREQSERVQSAVRSIPGYAESIGAESPSNMGDLIKRGLLPNTYDSASPSFSKIYGQAGIPGIKYLDQGSRAAGNGSRNYVVFDDKLVNILRKYGLVGLPFAGAAAPIFAPRNNSVDKS